jgi:hypothetical protein
MIHLDNAAHTSLETHPKPISEEILRELSNFNDERYQAAMYRSLPGIDPLLREPVTPQPEPPPELPPVRFEMGPEEVPAGSHGACSLSNLLSAWAAGHESDTDMVLLHFATTAGHLTGSLLRFEGTQYAPDIPIPTLVSTAGDTRFSNVAMAAAESLVPIQQELLAKYGDSVAAPAPKKPRKSAYERIREMGLKQFDAFIFGYNNPAKDMDPATQRNGPVRFIHEGARPAKPYKSLEQYHLYSALSVGTIEELPGRGKARETRIQVLASTIKGYLRGNVSIRGSMQFNEEDLEWMLISRRWFCQWMQFTALPVESLDVCEPDPLANQVEAAQELDRLHRMVLRRILQLRFAKTDCSADFQNEEAGLLFKTLRECYRDEAGAVSHMDQSSLILPDLFVWYLLQLNKSQWIDINEVEIAEHAIAAARRLRQRVAAFHDRYIALHLARKRLALATKIVARMKRLQGPCKQRDIARGLDDQRTEVIDPVISKLVALGVIADKAKKYLLVGSKNPREFQLNDFMEPIEDVPYSLVRRIALAEAYPPDFENTDEPQN